MAAVGMQPLWQAADPVEAAEVVAAAAEEEPPWQAAGPAGAAEAVVAPPYEPLMALARADPSNNNHNNNSESNLGDPGGGEQSENRTSL